jgi:hypothetical protein
MENPWSDNRVRVQAFSEAQQIKAARLVKDFVALCKANGLTVEHTAQETRGHRRRSFTRDEA